MKALLISLILFSLVLGGITANFLFVRRVADHMEELLDQWETSQEQNALLSELERYWEQKKKLLSLTVSFRDLDHVEETLVGLRWAYEVADEKELLRYRALLYDAIEEIARIERISIENLL